jgi:hypothetical protein
VARVEALGVPTGRIEHQQRPAGSARLLLGSDEQCRADALTARAPVHQHFRDLAPVRLVFRKREHELTVPMIVPSLSSAASTTRSARAALCATSRQYATAFSRDIGAMKLTEAPPATQSISTLLSASIWGSAQACRRRTRVWLGMWISAGRRFS